MIQQTAVELLPIWILLSISLGFLIGAAFGDSKGRRKGLEETNGLLRDELDRAHSNEQSISNQLVHQTHVIHKQVSGVTKTLQKQQS